MEWTLIDDTDLKLFLETPLNSSAGVSRSSEELSCLWNQNVQKQTDKHQVVRDTTT